MEVFEKVLGEAHPSAASVKKGKDLRHTSPEWWMRVPAGEQLDQTGDNVCAEE